MPGTQEAVRALGLQSRVVNAATPEEYERAFTSLKSQGVNGVVLLADPSNIEHAGKIAELAQQARLLTAFQLRDVVAAGGLMSYGAENDDQFRLAASMSIAFCGVRRPPNCQCSCRRSSTSPSTSRPPRLLASMYHSVY